MKKLALGLIFSVATATTLSTPDRSALEASNPCPYRAEEDLRADMTRHLNSVFDDIFYEQQKIGNFHQRSKPTLEVLEREDPENLTLIKGLYFNGESKIHMYLGHALRRGELHKKCQAGLLTGLKVDLEYILAHELAHHFTYNRAIDIWALSYVMRSSSLEGQVGIALVDEGIAEYYANKTRPGIQDENQLTDNQFIGLEEFPSDQVYYAGHQLLREILDLHGAKAVDYLLMNTINDISPQGLKAYRSSALEQLKQLVP